MKILHTSDWHLGQRLLQMERHDEFAAALDWLLLTIAEQAVDVLLVSGDVFDIGNPPNQARQLYYSFLRRLMATPCRHVVITGGNHDSPAMLNAPRELLQAFNIHIVGAATGELADELIVLKDAQGHTELVVAAVPFLRDRDLRTTLAGEGIADRQARLQTGLTGHYQALAELAQPYRAQGIPVVAMGHLYAKGAVAAEKQDNIYIGNRENMEAGQFPELFDYVALGHIHRAQLVEGAHRVRYSGSLVPLSFSETADDKQVFVLTFTDGALADVARVDVPVFRRLKTIQGSLEQVQESLERFAAKPDRTLTPWVEVIVDTDVYLPQMGRLLQDFCKEMPIELVKIRINRPYETFATDLAAVPDLEDLDVEEVFRQKCLAQGMATDEVLADLLDTFKELQNALPE